MSEITKQLGELYKLQLIESEMIEAMRECRRLEKADTPVAVKYRKIMAEIEEVEEEAKPAKSEIAKLRDENSLLNDKKKVVEDKLFTAGVDPKELQFLQKEREQIYGLIKRNDDQITRSLIKVDGAALRSKELGVELAEIEAEYKKEQKTRDESASALKARVEALKAQRQEFRDFPNREMFTLYQRLQKENDGIAIVTISGGVCEGCFIEVSAATVSGLQNTDKINRCQRCGRILYLGEEVQG